MNISISRKIGILFVVLILIISPYTVFSSEKKGDEPSSEIKIQNQALFSQNDARSPGVTMSTNQCNTIFQSKLANDGVLYSPTTSRQSSNS